MTTPGAGSGATSAETLTGHMARLTPRDQWILDLVAEHRVFSTEQLTALAFGSRSRALDRLGILHRRELLARWRHYQPSGSQAFRWTLGPAGAALLAAQAGKPLPRPAAIREATMRVSTSPQLGHQLGVNGFFTALIHHTRTHPQERLARWWGTTRTAAHAQVVRPDGHGLWTAGRTRVPFWLEYDTDTETLTVLRDKLTRYALLTGTPLAYPVLFWLPSAGRERAFRTHLDTHGTAATDDGAGLVLATAHAEAAETAAHGSETRFLPAGPKGPVGPVWSPWPGSTADRIALAALPVRGRA